MIVEQHSQHVFRGFVDLNYGKIRVQLYILLHHHAGNSEKCGHHPQTTVFPGLHGFQILLPPIQRVERLVDVHQKGSAVGVELHPGWAPVEKLNAQIRFQTFDDLAERRLCDVQTFGGFGDILCFRRHTEIVQLIEFHGDLLPGSPLGLDDTIIISQEILRCKVALNIKEKEIRQ